MNTTLDAYNQPPHGPSTHTHGAHAAPPQPSGPPPLGRPSHGSCESPTGPHHTTGHQRQPPHTRQISVYKGRGDSGGRYCDVRVRGGQGTTINPKHNTHAHTPHLVPELELRDGTDGGGQVLRAHHLQEAAAPPDGRIRDLRGAWGKVEAGTRTWASREGNSSAHPGLRMRAPTPPTPLKPHP